MKKNMFSLKKLSTKTIVIVIAIAILILFIGMCYFSPLQEGATNNNTCKVKIFIKDACNKCKQNKRHFDELKKKLNGTTVNGILITVSTVNNIKEAKKYKIKTFPTIIAEVNGKKITYKSNDLNSNSLKNWVLSQCQ